MATGATGQLGLALPVQGELSGTWGNTVNNGITEYTNIAIAATLTLTGDGAVTLQNTTGDASATNIVSSLTGAGTATAQFAIVRVTGTLTTTKIITAPSYSKTYIVVNAATGSTVSFIRSGQTPAVSIAVGESAYVYYNGTDYVKLSSTVASGVTSFSAGTTGLTPTTGTAGAVTLAGTLAIGNGGTGATTQQAAMNALAGTQTANRVLRSDGTNTTLSQVALATDVAGTLPIANGGTGTTSTTFVNLASNVTGTLPINNGGTGATTLSGAGIPTVGAANTFTGTQTFQGTTSVLAMVLNDAAEVATVTATAATGTINYDITTQSVLYYTSNASANWTVNFRASSGTTLNSALSTGQSVTVAFLVTQGSTAYFNNSVQVDGTTSGVTMRWLGGAPTAGNASGIDSYRYLIIKTGSATYTILASVTQFKA